MLLVEVTDTGRQVANRFRPIVHQQQKVWLESLGEEEQQRLIASLQQVQASLMDSDASSAGTEFKRKAASRLGKPRREVAPA